MVRTQIQITDGQARLLRQLAHRRGVSLAEIIRQCIDRSLEEHGPDADLLYEGAARLEGAARDRDERTDLSARHDDYAAAAFSPARRRRAAGRASATGRRR
ncbi:MAG: ribbon-helix-helix protein, CopG family [Deltaproteobacteria bacterium]|nr:ribbon-helix-helix protein, CopG family [Deltaproteobacteria bacterium]